MIQEDNKTNKVIASVLSGGLIIICLIFIVALVRLQFYTPKNSSYLPSNSHPQTIEPIRGTIYDVNGNPLALATPSYDIIIDCKAHKNEWIGEKAKKAIMEDEKITNKSKAIAIKQADEDFWESEIQKVAVAIDSILKADPNCTIHYSGSSKDLAKQILDYRLNGRKNNLKIATNVFYHSYKQIKQLNIISSTTYKNPVTGKKKSFSGCLLPPTEKNENYRIIRHYPYGQLARKVIGENNSKNRTYNCTGIEGRYDAALRGVPGTIYLTTADGQKEIADVDSLNIEPQNGYDVHTTLDIRIQEIAHRALKKGIMYVSNHPRRPRPCFAGTAIVMESQTGAIRAMVNLGLDETDGKWKENQLNYAVTQATSPGSVFKSVLMMQLLDDKKITLDTKIPTFKGHYDAGIFNNGKKPYDDEDLTPTYMSSHWYLKQNYSGRNLDSIKVRDAFAISSNNAFRWLAVTHYGKDASPYVNKIFQVKFREPFEFDIERPATPKFPTDPLTKGPTLPTLAIGTNIDITPLHVLAFYNAIALDGKMVQPYLIDHFSKGEERIDNTDFGNTGPRILKSSICSEETAQTLKTGLREVVLHGTAYYDLRDLPEESAIAGKTGTCRYYSEFTRADGSKYMAYDEEGTGKRRYQATFVGFWPYEKPQYTVIVVMYSKPSKETLYGSAGVPIFKDIYSEMYGMGL